MTFATMLSLGPVFAKDKSFACVNVCVNGITCIQSTRTTVVAYRSNWRSTSKNKGHLHKADLTGKQQKIAGLDEIRCVQNDMARDRKLLCGKYTLMLKAP